MTPADPADAPAGLIAVGWLVLGVVNLVKDRIGLGRLYLAAGVVLGLHRADRPDRPPGVADARDARASVDRSTFPAAPPLTSV